jgi:hypothetical protein
MVVLLIEVVDSQHYCCDQLPNYYHVAFSLTHSYLIDNKN